MRGFLWDPPRVPTYYNFAWVPHTFGGLTPPDPLISHTAASCYDIGTASSILNSHAVPAWLFLYIPSYSRIGLGDQMAGVSYAPLSSAPLVSAISTSQKQNSTSSHLSVSKSTLRLDLSDDLQLLQVDLQPLVRVAGDRLLRTPRSAVPLRADPKKQSATSCAFL